VARWRLRPVAEIPEWVRATRVPPGWPGGFASWWAAVGAWWGTHPEFFPEFVASLSVPVDTRERDGTVA